MKRTKLAARASFLLAAVFVFVGFYREAFSNVIIRTVPEQTTAVADGVTEYRMDVVGDTTGELGREIRSASWQVYIPDQTTFTNAALPDGTNYTPGPSQAESDFFYGWPMNPSYNYVDSCCCPGRS